MFDCSSLSAHYVAALRYAAGAVGVNHFGVFSSVEQARLAVFEYLEGYYFNARRHCGLGYHTPRENVGQVNLKSNP